MNTYVPPQFYGEATGPRDEGVYDHPDTLSILLEAESLIHGQRSRDYGHPKMNFQRIADLWNAYIKYSTTPGVLTPTDTAVMMILLKVARLQQNPTNRDSVVDIAGYAGTIERLWED